MAVFRGQKGYNVVLLTFILHGKIGGIGDNFEYMIIKLETILPILCVGCHRLKIYNRLPPSIPNANPIAPYPRNAA